DVTLSRLLAAMDFAGCQVALHPDDRWWSQTDAARDTRIDTCAGGAERSDSVLLALEALAHRAGPEDWVLVHDVARPCLSQQDLHNLVQSLADHPVGGLLACPVSDTLKQADAANAVAGTLDRRRLWRALTPQMFRYGALRAALEQAGADGIPLTDEASAMEHAGLSPQLVEGRPDNIKVTVPADLGLAEFVLSQLTALKHT
ncbi:MAG: 2-C-methyl-D-erythritol 4-phosphate cytidylyltransferase, partial [Marinobacter sp.]|uniref:2-C-methyl-D-erythritol 4-phosphate cytidylyltransferase n=1 Tax=Marinobacter sp. TaxID=50741 RepID=UPI00299F13F0